MDSVISLLQGTPIPTILVLSGVVFLFLALAGQVAGKLEVPPARQKWAAAVGAVFLAVGLLLYLSPGMPRQTPATGRGAAEDSANFSAAPNSDPATVAEADQNQDPIAPEGDMASAGDALPVTGAGECLESLFTGIDAERVVRVESGKSSKELLATHQTKKEPAGIILLELGQPVAALSYVFVEGDELFKIGRLVDGACQPAEYANGSRGGDRDVLQNWDTLEVTSGDIVYAMRFGYSDGVVSLDTSKFLK